jgi:hypothetical protein
MLVIIATWEAAIGRTEVSGLLGKKLVRSHLNQRPCMVVFTCRP